MIYKDLTPLIVKKYHPLGGYLSKKLNIYRVSEFLAIKKCTNGALFYLVKKFYFLSKSLISVNKTSSLVGSGGAAGAASSCFFILL